MLRYCPDSVLYEDLNSHLICFLILLEAIHDTSRLLNQTGFKSSDIDKSLIAYR